MKFKIFLFFSTFFLTFFSVMGMRAVDAAVAPLPFVNGQYAVAIDAQTGEVLYDKGMNTQWYPASLTKLLTAILLVTKIPNNAWLTTSTLASLQTPSNSEFLLQQGEKIDKEDALHALLMISANDVAESVAEYIAQNDQNFSVLMNRLAKKIGCEDTHFVNPNGLFDPNHYSTPYDIALIARYALRYPAIVQTIGTKYYTIHTNRRTVSIENQNQILGQPGVVGGKMGFVNESGNNLMEVFKQNGQEIITVVMDTDLNNEYTDDENIAQYAFSELANGYNKTVSRVGQTWGTGVLNQKTYQMVAKENITVPYIHQRDQITTKIIRIQPHLFVKKNQIVGWLNVYFNRGLIQQVPLYASRSIAKIIPVHHKWLKIWLAILTPIAGYVGYTIWYNAKINKRKNRKTKRQKR